MPYRRPILIVLSAFLVLTFDVDPVVAEVCDKMLFAPATWSPSMGAHSMFVPQSKLIWPVVAALLAAWSLHRLAMQRTAIFISVILCLVGLMLLGWAFSGGTIDEARPMAIEEGCYSVAADVFSAFVILAVAALFALVGLARKKETIA